MTERFRISVRRLRNRLHRWGRNLLHNRLWVRFGGVTYFRVPRANHRLDCDDPGLDRNSARLYLRASRLVGRTIGTSETAISVPHLGMFGNAMAAFMPVVARAISNQIAHVVVHHESVLSSPDEFGKRGRFELASGITLWLDSAPTRRNNRISALLGDKALTAAPDEETGSRAWSEVSNILLGEARLRCTDESTLVIHLRGGDVYGGNRHLLNHGQPPLAYYELVLDKEPWNRVVVVHQGTKMPVFEPLILACQKRKIPVETQSENLMADLSRLLTATTIVAGRGSFVPQIVGLSRCVKTVYTFESGFGLSVPKAGLTVHRVFDDAGEYRKSVLSNNWRNTPEQRRLQVEYPVDALRLEV